MKAIFAALLLANALARADDLKCPDTYPDSPISLPASSGQIGSGVVRRAIFSNAYLYAGKLHGDAFGFDAMVGTAKTKRVKGGWDTEYTFTPSETKWLVCAYGGNELFSVKPRRQGPIELWEQIAPDVTQCVLQVREIKQPYRLPGEWSAAAICKNGK
ncbi:STY0301 family protein [Massilia rhizosphaerae]|uniref:STY0301 family protein n=1 Tax=Massilia rhizosphaerae TaxID=2784389 RepID=UPI0018DE8E78|nr:STY0301 family protein [Massilia rhizosphaerae]